MKCFKSQICLHRSMGWRAQRCRDYYTLASRGGGRDPRGHSSEWDLAATERKGCVVLQFEVEPSVLPGRVALG